MHVPHVSSSMVVRPMRAEDVEEARRIATRAFGCNCLAWYPPEVSLVGEDASGALVCALQFKLEDLWWGDALIPGYAIGNVATDPAHQGKGYAGALMLGAIRHMRELGKWASPLWPFSFAYYGKYGWALPRADQELRVWPDMVRKMSAATGITVEGVRPLIEADIFGVAACYTRSAQRTNCQSNRPEAWWRANTPERCLVLEEGGEIAGFTHYAIQRPKRTQGDCVRVTEIHGRGVREQAALVCALAELPNVTELVLHLPADSVLYHLFPDYITIGRLQCLALRVADVAKALECLKPGAGLRGQLAFEVMDWTVDAEKPVCVTAEIADGHVEARAGSASQPLRCSINAFTQLFAGGISTAEARALGWLEGGCAETDRLCDALLHARGPFRAKNEMG